MNNVIENILELTIAFLPALITAAIVVGIVVGVRIVLERRFPSVTGGRFRIQVILMLLSFAGILAVIMALPISENTRGQLLSLIGILLSAAIALSATTFVGNIMAGMMLRVVKSFRLGDFISCQDHFGRVSERGLFHVEIQTEDRNLTSIPNQFLVTNPVRVVRSSGTMVSADLSLGYDVSHTKIMDLLKQAAHKIELQEPFVHILELGNYAVTYRVAGLLTDVKYLLSVRSQLRAAILDTLHQNRIEIVSPTFMNTRAYDTGDLFVPPVSSASEKVVDKDLAEAVVFDKADEAESTEKLHERLNETVAKLKTAKASLERCESEEQKTRLQAEIDRLTSRQGWLMQLINRREKESD